MIDLHCHILPGIDDGAQNMEESLAMAKLAVSEGITHILATPHHLNRTWINPKSQVLNLVDQVQDELDRAGIDLTLFPGQEVRINGELKQHIQSNEICFVDEFDKYIMVEFPTPSVPEYTERLFFELMSQGIRPVVVHPERNTAIQENPDLLYDLVDKGALSQLTAGSYVGALGSDLERFSRDLIEADLVHLIASDAHNTSSRPFYMKEAFEKLTKEFDLSKAKDFDQVSRDLVNGDDILVASPSQVSKMRKRFFGLF